MHTVYLWNSEGGLLPDQQREISRLFWENEECRIYSVQGYIRKLLDKVKKEMLA
jgi:hypothetical protein